MPPKNLAKAPPPVEMCEILFGCSGLVDGGYGIAASYDRGGPGSRRCGDRFGDFESAFGEGGHFEYAHWAVPDDRLGFRDFGGVCGSRLGADVEAHLVGRRGGDVADRCGRIGLEFRRDDMIGWKHQLEVFRFGISKQALGEFEFVVFDERLADLQALRFFERVGHAAADQHHVGDLH